MSVVLKKTYSLDIESGVHLDLLFCFTVILELALDIVLNVLSELSMLPPTSLGKLVNLQIILLMKEEESDLFNK